MAAPAGDYNNLDMEGQDARNKRSNCFSAVHLLFLSTIVSLTLSGCLIYSFYIYQRDVPVKNTQNEWFVGSWGPCSEPCNLGVQNRTVECSLGENQCSSKAPESTRLCNPEPCKYDFIVVGGGLAGCALAARLSEDPSKTVLLLESGGPTQANEILGGTDFTNRDSCKSCDRNEGGKQYTRFDVPLMWLTIPWDSDRGYTIKNVPEAVLANALGGGAVMNAMIYKRALPLDMKRWKENGVEGWDWETILPIYKRVEANRNTSLDPAYHGFGGDWPVSDPADIDEGGRRVIEAAVQAGLPRNYDFNGASRKGAGHYQFNIDGGLRHSPLKAMLFPAMKRANLHVSVFSTVKKVIFEGTRAVGVEYERIPKKKGEKPYPELTENLKAYANKEVILTAGAIGSAKLLMLSGVGPKTHLSDYSIPLVKDMPGVGGNLHDHASINLDFNWPSDTYPSAYFVTRDIWFYDAAHAGVLAYVGTIGGGYFESPYSDYPGIPDIQFTVFPNTNRISVSVTLNLPTTRTKVELQSADYRTPAYIKYGSSRMQTEHDLKALAWATQEVRRWATFPPLADVIQGEYYKDLEALNTTEGVIQYLKAKPENSQCGNHWVGSAKMGKTTDPQAVVDSRLRVIGLQGLRVADASVFPFITNGNIAATIELVAERCAEFIKEEYAN